jgi:hypothetical protein
VTVRRSRKHEPELPTISMSDIFKQRLGWKKPSNPQPFYTSADRQCGDCRVIKAGSEFDVPITPGRPDLNTCRQCRGYCGGG